MKRMSGGRVDRDGRSALPQGLVDSSAGAETINVSPEIQARLDAIFTGGGIEEVKAKYKLEVAFNDERSMSNPYIGIVTAWTNGGFANGGGDEAVYFCTNLIDKAGVTRTCSAPIDLKFIGRHAAICPTCRSAVHPDDLAGQVTYKATTQNWAIILMKIWLGLGGDADIRMGIMRENLRQRTDDIMKRVSLSAGDKIDIARGKRHWASYPLRNIIKDTGAGADLQGRIRAFISS
jgi:hypothetical protein